MILAVILGVLLFVVATGGFVVTATAVTMHDSDPAGNGLAAAFFLLFQGVQAVLIGVVAIVAGCLGGSGEAGWVDVAATVAWVVMAASSIAYVPALGDRRVPRAVRAVVVGFPAAAILYGLHRGYGVLPAAAGLWLPAGMTAACSALPWAMLLARSIRRRAATSG